MAYFEGKPPEPEEIKEAVRAQLLAILGGSVTIDDMSPVGAIKAESPVGVPAGAVVGGKSSSCVKKCGSHKVMVRGTSANVRICNGVLEDVEGACRGDSKPLLFY